MIDTGVHYTVHYTMCIVCMYICIVHYTVHTLSMFEILYIKYANKKVQLKSE